MKLPLADVGAATEKALINALDDLFGPSVRELGQWMADSIRQRRMDSLRKVVERAKTLNGEEEISPPSDKFMINFSEKASLEDDPLLVDRWARLLIEAAASEEAKHLYFQDILSRLRRDEATLFDAVVQEPLVKRGAISQIEDVENSANERVLRNIIKKEAMGNLNVDELFRIIVRNWERYGLRCIAAAWSIPKSDSSNFWDDVGWELEKNNRISLDLMQQLGIVSNVNIQNFEFRNISLDISVCCVTPLGAEFFYSTHDPELRKIPAKRRAGVYPDEGFVPIEYF